jgi:nucleoside-diphosphate-sugar epimerase
MMVLVTFGAGFIGSHVAGYYLNVFTSTSKVYGENVNKIRLLKRKTDANVQPLNITLGFLRVSHRHDTTQPIRVFKACRGNLR